MGLGKERLKKEIESAVIFALAREPKEDLIQQIEHWTEVSNFIFTRKLAGRFYRRLKEKNLLNLVSSLARERLEQFYHFCALKNQILFQELKRVSLHLERKQIKLILLKGASLILRGVYQPGERYQADLDFLVQGIAREQLTEELSQLGYLPVEHSDAQSWSEASFVLPCAGSAKEIGSVFLEFHWTFRPINHSAGEELAQEILRGSEALRYNSTFYQVPCYDLQFYHAGLHGCAYHPFDSGYFWVSLQDLSALASYREINRQLVIQLALKQGLAEHLGVLIFLLADKLGFLKEFWEELGEKISSRELVGQTARTIWDTLLSPRPISLSHIIYLFCPTEAGNRRKALLELSGLRRKGDEVKVNNQEELTNPRPGFFSLFLSRLRTLDWQFLKMVWQTAKFYRKVKVYFPWGA